MPGEAIETEAELQVVVRFVIPRGKTEVTVSEALSLGYDQSSDADHGPVWVAEEEVLSLVSPALDDVGAGPPQDAEVAPVHLGRVARPEPAIRRELLRRGLGLVVVPSRHNIHVYHTCLGTLPCEHVAAGHQQLPRLARVHTEAVLVRLRHHLAAAVLLPAEADNKTVTRRHVPL